MVNQISDINMPRLSTIIETRYQISSSKIALLDHLEKVKQMVEQMEISCQTFSYACDFDWKYGLNMSSFTKGVFLLC